MATTSGTSAFNLDLNDLIEEAFERCGTELRSGYDFRTARRSLNLLTIEWANRGINLWTIEQGQIPMNSFQSVYALPTDTIDLLDHVIRTNNGSQSNQIDINITRISESTYSTIPNKNTNGRPIQVWINRQTGHSPTAPATTLAGNITNTDTTIPLVDASSLPLVGFITIGSELIAYQNIDVDEYLRLASAPTSTPASSASWNAHTVDKENMNDIGRKVSLIYWGGRPLMSSTYHDGSDVYVRIDYPHVDSPTGPASWGHGFIDGGEFGLLVNEETHLFLLSDGTPAFVLRTNDGLRFGFYNNP